MSKLVSWGRWLVAAFLGIEGFSLLVGSVIRIIYGVIRARHGEPVSFYSEYMDLLWSIPLLLCARGVMKWRPWAHHLALFVAIVNLGIAVPVFFLFPRGGFGIEMALITLVAASMATWLLLPTVRTEYRQREQVA